MSHPSVAPLPPAVRACLPRLGSAVLMLALAGCTIMLPDAKQPPVNAEANAAVPPPPGMTAPAPTAIDRGDPIPEPQTYRGVIPCADCSGQRITLTLMPDWTWRLRRVYFGTRDNKEATFISTGRWLRSVDNPRRINLIGDRNDTGLYEFAPGSGSTLRVVEQEGQPVASSLNYSLTQQFEVDPIADTFNMRGKVVASGGNATFAICGTGKPYPVAKAAQGQALTDAVARLRIAPGASTLMWIDGRIISSGQPPQEQVVVEALTQGTLDSPCD